MKRSLAPFRNRWALPGGFVLHGEAIGDAAEREFFEETGLRRPTLAFNHDQILNDGLDRARAKLEYTTLTTSFLPPKFTIADLRSVYETIWNVPLDPANFRRKVR